MPPSSLGSPPSRPLAFSHTTFDVQVFADALFGTENGGKADLGKADVMTRRIIQKRHAEGGPAEDAYHRWRAEFCARYLHRFIGFLLPRLPHAEWTSFELGLASMLLGSNYYTRWVRTAPAAMVELLFVRLVQSWSRTCPNLVTIFEAEVQGENVLVGTRGPQIAWSFYYAQQLSYLLTHFPSDNDLRTSSAFSSPTALPSFLRDLLTLASRCSRLITSGSADAITKTSIYKLLNAPEAGMEILMYYLLHPKKSAPEVRAYFQSKKGNTCWWNCAVTPSGERASCSTSNGEEMMACARCQTVRYCSKDHQRAHWKEHKKRCFPIEWEF